MYTIIICAVIFSAMIVTLFLSKRWIEDFIDFLLVTIGAILAFLGGALVGLLIGLCLPKYYVYEKATFELESIQDNSSISGSFFLGSGRVNGTMSYAFYYKNSDNEYKLQTVDANNSAIIYTDSIPIFEQYTLRMVNNNWSILGMYDGQKKYKFKIPQGSIKNNFNLDTE